MKHSVDTLLADTPGRAEREARGRAAGHATIAARGANVGSTEIIRECLREPDAWREGLTKAMIAERTGIPFRTVSSVVSSQASHTGGLVSFGKKGWTKYALIDSPAGQKALGKIGKLPRGEFAIAQSVLTFAFKPLKRNPFEHMELALATRTT